MATEYIEKQAAKEKLCSMCRWEGTSNCDDCEHPIDDIPPANVRPVVRGKWIKVGGFYTPGGDPVWECSECGKGRHVYGVEHGTYGADISDGQWVACPNCGARMEDGESDG